MPYGYFSQQQQQQQQQHIAYRIKVTLKYFGKRLDKTLRRLGPHQNQTLSTPQYNWSLYIIQLFSTPLLRLH